MMSPFAFDFTSTFESGSIFPRATTERAISPRSIVTIFSGGIGLDPRKAPSAAKTTTRSTIIPNVMSNPRFHLGFIRVSVNCCLIAYVRDRAP